MTSRICNCLIAGLTMFLLCGSLQAQTDVFDQLQDPQQEGPGLTDQEVPDLVDRGPQQTVVVREDRAGWQAAGTGLARGRLSDKLRANWVMVDANGLLRGTVIGFDSKPVGDVMVKLIKDGQVVNSTRVNRQGQFSFNNVQQGAYGLVGFGSEHFFAFGFDAIRNSDNPKAIAPQAITVMATPNATTINTDWIAFFGPSVKYRVYGRYDSREGTDDPEALYGTDGISTHYPEAYPSTSIQSHAVTSLSDGRLIGRVHQIDSLHGRPVDVRNTRVMLLQNDDVYAATSTDNYGVFAFSRIEPGYYSLVAAGDDGLAAIGIEVVDAGASDPAAAFEDEAAAGNNDEQVVPIDLTLMPSEAAGWLLSYANEEAYQRVLIASAKANALQSQCNCPPMSAAQREALVRALQPSKRGAFWKRLNTYFDEIFYGADASQGNAPAPGYSPYGQPNYSPAGYAPGYAPAPMMQRSIPMNQPYSAMPPVLNSPSMVTPPVPSETILRTVPSTDVQPVPRSNGNDTTFYPQRQYQNSGYQNQGFVPAQQSGYNFSDR